ncbi:MAG TPA: Rrf2 family transcriptional regulator [Gemmatimonadaceae bacterium]
MPRSTRFSVALHVLAHLVEAPAPQTSEQLAACVGTNPVVVRRTLAGLRAAGLVTSSRGTGGGWSLARDAAHITLRDVYAALDERLLQGIDVAVPRVRRGGCLIQRAVSGTLDEFLDDAEALLAARLSRITVAALVTRVRGLQRHARDPVPRDHTTSDTHVE